MTNKLNLKDNDINKNEFRAILEVIKYAMIEEGLSSDFDFEKSHHLESFIDEVEFLDLDKDQLIEQ